MTLLARLIAREEGLGIAGDVPTRAQSGDLRHAPGRFPRSERRE